MFSLLMSGMTHPSGTTPLPCVQDSGKSVLASGGSAIAFERLAIQSCPQACHVIWTFGLYCWRFTCWLSGLLLASHIAKTGFESFALPLFLHLCRRSSPSPCLGEKSVKKMIAFLAGEASYPSLLQFSTSLVLSQSERSLSLPTMLFR